MINDIQDIVEETKHLDFSKEEEAFKKLNRTIYETAIQVVREREANERMAELWRKVVADIYG